MKKLVFVMPLMAISLLASCGGSNPNIATCTLTFDCQQCKAFDEDNKQVTKIKVRTVKSERTMYQKFHFTGAGVFKAPLKSSIAVKKTGTEETIDCKYVHGEVLVPIIGDLTISAKGTSYTKSLEESTWAEIAEIAETGRADEFFDIYDPDQPELNCKKVYLIENGEPQTFPHAVRIIDFNHDNLADKSGKAGITFEFANVITKGTTTPTEQYGTIWDDENNNDYRNSTLNNALNNKTAGVDSVINRLPEDLEKVIKPVDKKVGVSTDEGQNYTATSFDGEDYPYPYLFPLAHDEITADSSTEVTPDEGDIYQYYKEHKEVEDRIKKAVEYDSGAFYWLRSPYTFVSDMYNDAWDCFPTGVIGSFYVYNGRSIAPAFCI